MKIINKTSKWNQFQMPVLKTFLFFSFFTYTTLVIIFCVVNFVHFHQKINECTWFEFTHENLRTLALNKLVWRASPVTHLSYVMARLSKQQISGRMCLSAAYSPIRAHTNSEQLILSAMFRGYCTPGPYFWGLGVIFQKIKQLWITYPIDLIRSVQRNSKITVFISVETMVVKIL